MDAKLIRKFVHVHQNSEGNVLSSKIVEDLLGLNEHRDCTVTEYAGTISIACQSLGGLGTLADICTDDKEGPGLRFFSGLRAAIVKFIG